MPETIPLLILGLGNVLCRDDGLGAVTIERLNRRFVTPDGVLALDGGTLGLQLLPYLQSAIHAILVDAVLADAAPGSMVRLEGDEVAPAVRHRLSVHQIGVADLLDGARLLGRCPEHLVLLGVVPETTALGVGCSPAVSAAVPLLVEQIVEQARFFGFDFVPKRDAGMSSGVGRGDLDRILCV